jgi:hypothetical protein
MNVLLLITAPEQAEASRHGAEAIVSFLGGFALLVFIFPGLLTFLLSASKGFGCAGIILACMSWPGLLIALLMPNRNEDRRRHKETLRALDRIQAMTYSQPQVVVVHDVRGQRIDDTPPRRLSAPTRDVEVIAPSVPKPTLRERAIAAREAAREAVAFLRSWWHGMSRRKRKELKTTLAILGAISLAAVPVFWFVTRGR